MRFPKFRNIVWVHVLIILAITVTALQLTASAVSPTAAAANFVTRSGTKLMLNGSEYRIAGANSEWLLLHTYESTDAVQAGSNLVYYYSDFEIDDFFATVKEMGGNTVRMWLTVGCPKCLQPTRGNFNETTYQRFDKVIQSASTNGIRLIINVGDYWNYANGGETEYSQWRGGANFYTDPLVIGDFEAQIANLVNRTNTLTGTQYKNDPTILGYESCNECDFNSVPLSWTQTIADYIKSVDSNHLVIDGNEKPSASELALANVDMYTNHCYPATLSCLQGGSRAQNAYNAGKAFYIGEYRAGGVSLSDLDSNINSATVNGDLVYEVQPHNPQYGFTHHWQAHDQYYPYVDSNSNTLSLRWHFYHQRGITTIPASITPAAPTITNTNSSNNTIAWQGVMGGNTYDVDRSTSGASGPWTNICNQCATDRLTPWADTTRPAGSVWYRVRAFNLENTPGPYSAAYESDVNLALNKTVSARTSLENTNWGTQKAVDGYQYSENVFPGTDGVPFLGWNNANIYSSGYTSNPFQTSGNNTEWVQIDLGSDQTFNTVKLYPRTDVSSTDTVHYAANFPVNFTIQVKPSAGSFSIVKTVQNQQSPDIDPVSYAVGTQTARYILINVTTLGTPAWGEPGAYRLQFAEIEVFNAGAVSSTPTFQPPTSTPISSTKVDDSAGSYSGTWSSSGSVPGYYNTSAHWSSAAGSFVTYTFTGTGIQWIGGTNADHGKADVYIDGVLDTAGIDTYSAAWTKQVVLYTKTGLSNGSHTIKIVVTNAKNASSTGTTQDADAFIWSG